MNAPLAERDQFWPQAGLLGASYRVMFPFVAIWAIVGVSLWQWVDGPWQSIQHPVLWHVHEMLFGIGGAALAGYLPTACSSSTGRPPVAGWRVLVLLLLWIAARLAVASGHDFLALATAPLMFWWISVLLIWEERVGGNGVRPFFVLFTAVAGMISMVYVAGMRGMTEISSPAAAAFLFIVLLTVVGGKMVPSFLYRAVEWDGDTARKEANWVGTANLIALAGAGLVSGTLGDVVSGLALATIAGIYVVRMAFWPLSYASKDPLLAMLVLGFSWMPIGFALWAAVLLLPLDFDTAGVFHALIMGSMSGLIMAVSARSSAIRTEKGLRARRGVFLAFSLVWISVWLRVFGYLPQSALIWCFGWAIFLVAFLPALRGQVPRPIFSGTRR